MKNFTRKRLKHGLPEWVPDGANFFITINTNPRGRNQLAHPHTAQKIKEAVAHYTSLRKWHPALIVLMPDHLHAILSLNTANYTIRQIISPWKGYLARKADIQWQEGFFEHRLRNEDELREKAQYIRLNPVRAGLCKSQDDWPYIWTESDFIQR